MTPQDRDYLYAAGALLALATLYYFYEKSAAPAPALTPAQASGALPVPWASPMDGVYDNSAAAPSNAYAPPTQASLTVNVGDQAASELSDQYMPLFGFVGVAQGQMYS
jgi:hypothetical protein